MPSSKGAIKQYFWAALSIVVGIGIASVLLSDGTSAAGLFKRQAEPIALNEPTPELERVEELTAGPSYLIKRDAILPKISAEAYLVGDLESGDIILKKNPETAFPMASLSKLMTALVSITSYDQSAATTPTRRALATYGSNGGLRAGEKIELSALLYPLLLESSNDAAEVISEYQNRSQFIAKMNSMAQTLSLEKTTYTEPTGLSAENRSTVLDLFKLTSYIQKNNPLIFDITKKPKYSYKNHTWYNISQFIRASGYAGSKSGFIDESKQTNVGLFTLPLKSGEERTLAVILLRSDSRKNDTDKLLSYVKQNVYYGDKEAYPFALPAEDKYAMPDDEIELAFVGDIMLARGTKQSADAFFGGDFSRFFEHVPQIRTADIAFGNLEGPASDKGADDGSIYSFRMEPRAIGALKEAGFDALSFANNHVGDWGREAFEDTIARLSLGGIQAVGVGKNKADAITPKIIEKKGIKVGFIGFSDVGPDWLAATDTTGGIVLARDKEFEEIVRKAAVQTDALVVSFHWGDEYSTEHTERQEKLAHLAIDNGAAIVVGHHPHVMQDTETYKGGIIAYSLGNFIFDQAFSADTRSGMLLTVRLKGAEVWNVNKRIVRFNATTFQPEKVVEE